MDPLEPARNDENCGLSRRRISSILKAPRKSVGYPAAEHQENLVECPKPVEKRNSRRVSFAPANNVLLFSNEGKQASPVRSPLHDLITTPATQHRVQITEDEIQQITGMETLLNAPLHAPQKRDKVNFHTEDAFGEKTVMFSAEDAFMDMTRSQTIDISRNADRLTDASPQGCDAFPPKDMNLLFHADSGAMGVTPKTNESIFGSKPLPTSRSADPMSDIRSICSKVPSLDPGFENFLAGLFKSNGPPRTDAEVSVASEEPRITGVDKENQAPQSVREGSLNASRKRDSSRYGSVMTEAVHAFADDDCSSSQLKQQQSGGTAASFPARDKVKNPSHQRDTGTLDRTVMFSAADEFMDMTQSHTVNIANQEKCSSGEHLRDPRSLPGASVSGLDRGFTDFLAGLSKTKPKEQGPEQSRPDADDGRRDQTVRFSADDACMDVTQSHTMNIVTHNVHAESGRPENDGVLGLPNCKGTETSKTGGEGTTDKTVTEAFMDVTQSHTVNIISGLGRHCQPNMGSLPAFGEKTVRFGADEAALDVTQSHTVKIISAVAFHPQHNGQRASPGGGTLTSPTSEVAMDETRSYTVSIDAGFTRQPDHNNDFIPMFGEKTVRFTDGDAAMDVTKSHTVKIASDLNVYAQQRSLCARPGEETETFDAAMDETQGLTGNISTCVDPQPAQNQHPPPALDEGTVRISADADVEVTSSHTADIGASVGVAPRRAVDTDVPSGKDSAFQREEAQLSEGNVESAASLKRREDERSPAPVVSNDTVQERGFLDQLGPQNMSVDTEEEAQGRLGSPVHQTVVDCPAVGLEVAPTEAQTDRNRSPDRPPQRASVNSCGTKSTCEEITSHHLVSDARLTGNKDKRGPRKQTSPKSDGATDGEPSRKSRRMSFADLHTKIRRLSHMISAAPDAVATETCQAPSTQQEQEEGRKHQEEMDPDPAAPPGCGAALVHQEDAEGDQNDVGPTQTAAETPFKLQTKQLMSRLSTGGFKAKLPQRTKASDGAAAPAGEPTKTLAASVPSQMRNFDADVSDINDEELDSCDDVSEPLDTKSPSQARVKSSPPKSFGMDGPLEDNVFDDDLVSAARGNKSRFPANDGDEDEKRLKAPGEAAAAFPTDSQPRLGDCDSSVTSGPAMMTQTTDESSSSHTASIRCEATFESTFKQSLFESQLEDYASDMQRKFDDGTITVLEFFKLFNIDFVIHTPRQSVLPERLLSDTERTLLDSLRDRHVHHPKHKVYETDVQNLTHQVARLKERMQDLDKPLRMVNRTLWEEMSSYTEKELKSFGAKLKERNNIFRKTSKVRSHQMKEALYSHLLQAQQAEERSLRDTIQKADEMIRSLDGCIGGLEAELARVVEKGCEESPSLRCLQQEMDKVTEALTDNNRQISDLEVQITQNSKNLKRLNADSQNLQDHVAALHTMSEWRVGGSSDTGPVFTFLYNTFQLQLSYHSSSGPAADTEPEKRISHIVFQHHFDEEKSQDHARIVHQLLSQYVQAEPDWVKKYPTGGHVPKLLHDVSLVVGHCRLLGEELRLLRTWGGLRLEILHIGCVDTLIHIVFSSLRKFAKFEVIFSVALSGHHYVLRVHSFENMIGDTTLQQVEQVVASLSPGKNLLTKTVKKMFENLLR
ncbi:uncharacterized protein knl1 isoform X1 [Takifugu flavidus]|uniref:uncharacterized protein knl1 isoform X1 n=1 Tax=Takifugu flavidus TaxID=433684 RepID=UPI002544AFC6|nr:uncharacterized protein knl1 isoform X1 [Takifugu flavidus]